MIRIVEIIDIFINVLFNFSWYRSATVVYCIPACKIWVQVLKDIFVETIYNDHKSYTYKSLDWWPLCEIWIVFTSFKCDRAFLWAFICLPMVDLSVGLYSSAELSFTTFKPLKWYKIYSIIIHQLVKLWCEIWPPKIWYSCVNSPKICLRLIMFSNDPISFSVLSKRVCSRQIPRSITNIGLF